MAKNNPAALNKEALEHPAAFMASDGRTLYKYEGMDGNTIITPKPIEEMTQEEFLELPMALTDTQPGRLPQNLSVEFKDPQWAGYWFNKKAKFGSRVGYARTLGFVPAKIEDLKFWHEEVNDGDGAVEQYDLVLMKIHKAKLFGKFKEWIDKAKTLGGIQGYRDKAFESLGNARPKDKDLTYFHTPQALQEPQGLGRAPNE
jgi:hypothetical protein